MKRFGQWAFNAIAVGSLLLALVTAFLWLRGISTYDEVRLPFRSDLEWDFEPAQGTYVEQFRVLVHHFFAAGILGPLLGPQGIPPQWFKQINAQWGLQRADFDMYAGPITAEDSSGHILWWGEFYEANFPQWYLVVLFSILPAIASLRWAWRVGRRRMRREGLCGVCGYDLRATPDRCPECGTAAAKTEVSK